jgi:hypothetical protein
MKALTCAAAHRRLQAYHDGELTIEQQIEVEAHLEWCDVCATDIAEMRMVRQALRSLAPARGAAHEPPSFHASVVSRIKVEKTVSWSAQIRDLFDDMPFVYAGLGAAGATVVFLAIMVSMMRFAEHMAPGSNQNPVVVDARMLMPRVLNDGFAPAASTKGEDETAFTLSAVVTREGRLVNLELHPENGQQPAAGSIEARAVAKMLGAISQARFEPARVGGFPIAVNMVWLVAHTTVRAAKLPSEESATTPVAPRRRAVVGAPRTPTPPAGVA